MSLLSLAEKPESVCRINFIGKEDRLRCHKKSKPGDMSSDFVSLKGRGNIFFRFDDTGRIMSLLLTCFIDFS